MSTGQAERTGLADLADAVHELWSALGGLTGQVQEERAGLLAPHVRQLAELVREATRGAEVEETAR